MSDSGKAQGKSFDWKVIKRIFAYVSPYKKYFYLALLVTIILSALTISRPLLIQAIIDGPISHKNYPDLVKYSLILIVILVTEGLLQYSNIFITSFIGQNIISDLRNKIYKHILNFNSKYFDNNPIGMLVTRSVSDIEALADVFSQGFIVIMGDILTMLVFVVTMFFVHVKLTLIVLCTIPLLIIATRIFKRGVAHTFGLVRNAVSNLNTFVQEHIQGMKLVQTFNREEQEYEKFDEINKKHRDANIKSIWYYSVFFPAVEIISSLAIALVIMYLGFAEKLEMTTGTVTFFILLTNMLFRPIRMMADRLNTLQMGIVSAERVFKILDIEQSIENKGVLKPEIKGEIEFRNVDFAYNDSELILKNVSFKVKQGESLAIVGETGSGKSTIINLLPRYYDINSGSIYIDSIKSNDIELDFLRRKIAIVQQDVFLFSDTIYNNITLGNEEISLEEVIEASKLLGAYDFIMKMPSGFEFNVGERGISLSAGQKQLVSIIRAFVYKPVILILDEATSSIDSESELVIQKAIATLTQNRTSIIVAHRLSTIKNATEIIVLKKGVIIEQGDAKTLLESKGEFFKSYYRV